MVVVTLHFARSDGPGPPPVDRSGEADAGLSGAETPHDSVAGDVDPEDALPFDCPALLGGSSGSLALASNRKRFGIRAFLGSLQDQGFTWLGQRLVADLAGVGADDFGRPGYAPALAGASGVDPPRTAAYSLPRTDGQYLSIARRNRLREAFQAPGIDPLLDEFRADPSVLRGYWLPDDSFDADQATTVLGHAVRLRGRELYRALDAMPEDLAFGLHELAVAVDHGVGAADLSAILDRSEVDSSASWRNSWPPRDNTLALVAALGGNPDALQVLLARGSDPSIGRRSVLDELPLSTERTDAYREVARVLLADGDRPYLPSTRSALKRWLPGLAVLPLHPDAEVELAASDMEGSARELATLVEDWNRGVAHATRLEQHCRDSWHGAAILSHAGVSLAAKTRRQDELDKRHGMALQEKVRSNAHLIRETRTGGRADGGRGL